MDHNTRSLSLSPTLSLCVSASPKAKLKNKQTNNSKESKIDGKSASLEGLKSTNGGVF